MGTMAQGGVTGSATITAMTAVTCAGQTSIDFTGIPSWARRITVIFNGVSTSSTSPVIIQLGTSSSIENTSYLSTSQNAATGSAGVTAGFSVAATSAAANSLTGNVFLYNVSGNTWIESGDIAQAPGTSSNVNSSGGSKVLSGTLTQVRITTVGGTDTFDTTPSAGSINVYYE
jgi:hypothetical protein